jgi:hypothetical protein
MFEGEVSREVFGSKKKHGEVCIIRSYKIFILQRILFRESNPGR